MKKENHPRLELARDSAIFQLKLVADGLRDAALIPIAFIASLIGIARGGKDADKEFRQVVKLGRRSEQWINLFGHQRPLSRHHPAGSMDKILGQVEAIVIEQYKKGKSTDETRQAVREAMRSTKEEQKKDSQ